MGDIFNGNPWKNGNLKIKDSNLYSYLLKPARKPANTYELKGSIAVVENKLPLKKWTITDVIKRVFDLVEEVSYVKTIAAISTSPRNLD